MESQAKNWEPLAQEWCLHLKKKNESTLLVSSSALIYFIYLFFFPLAEIVLFVFILHCVHVFSLLHGFCQMKNSTQGLGGGGAKP